MSSTEYSKYSKYCCTLQQYTALLYCCTRYVLYVDKRYIGVVPYGGGRCVREETDTSLLLYDVIYVCDFFFALLTHGIYIDCTKVVFNNSPFFALHAREHPRGQCYTATSRYSILPRAHLHVTCWFLPLFGNIPNSSSRYHTSNISRTDRTRYGSNPRLLSLFIAESGTAV